MNDSYQNSSVKELVNIIIEKQDELNTLRAVSNDREASLYKEISQLASAALSKESQLKENVLLLSKEIDLLMSYLTKDDFKSVYPQDATAAEILQYIHTVVANYNVPF